MPTSRRARHRVRARVRARARLAVALALTLTPAVAAAQPEPAAVAPAIAAPAGYVPPDFIAAEPPLPAGAAGAQVWRLDLTETIQLAVRNNLDIVLEREQLAIARRGVDLARGELEPVLGIDYRRGDFRRPPVTADEGEGDVAAIDDALTLSYQQRFATGLRLGLDVDAVRTRSTAANAIDPINVRSTASLRVTQPLLRGFSLDLDVPRVTILRARLASDRERRQVEIVIADVVDRTEAAYWDVVAALYRHDLEVRSAELAEEQLALTRRQIDSGVLPPSDLIGAESTVAQRRLQQVEAEQAVDQAWDRLRRVVNLPRDQWARPILPVERPTFAPGAVTAEQAMAIALANRPERFQLDTDAASAALTVRKADNDRLPQVDLGLTGSLIGQDSTYRGALSDLGGADTRGWQVMVDMTWTPLGRAAGAAAAIARSEQKIVAARREAALQAIWFDVKDAVRNQDSAARRVAAAARFRDLAQQSLDIEQRKFLNGTSSNFLVAQRQDELAAAQLAELSALLDHQKASTTVLHATGVLLTERGISLDASAR